MFRLGNVTLSNSAALSLRIRVVGRLALDGLSNLDFLWRSIYRDAFAVIGVYGGTRVSCLVCVLRAVFLSLRYGSDVFFHVFTGGVCGGSRGDGLCPVFN